jgi:hypothetical protein
MSISRPLAAFLAVALTVAAAPARAQFTLGDQRVGTSSMTFLKIGLGARAAGMGGAFVAVANDPSAIYWNPAGIASMQRNEVALSHVDWPAEVKYEHVAYVMPVSKLGGALAFQIGVLSTQIDETTDLQPFGTGRSFYFSDAVAGVAYGRRWTDKLLVGAGLKYVREDLGSDVGGPVTTGFQADIGSIYYLGYGSVRIATSLSNFGPALQPGGEWTSPASGEVRSYDSFDSPLMFRYGLAFEPYETKSMRVTTSIEANQPADDAQSVKAGVEWNWTGIAALRGGYVFNSDALKLSAGVGVSAHIGTWSGTVDYAYTDGGPLGAVNRLSLGLRF